MPSAEERAPAAGFRGLLTSPPLGDRLAWRDPIRSETMISADRGLMARTFGTIYIVAAVIGWTLLVIGEQHGRQDWVIAALSAAATLIGALCFVGYRRLPVWLFHTLLVTGSLMITAGVAGGSQGAEGVYALYYVWVAFLGFLFLRQRAAIAHVALALVAFAAVMIARDAAFTINFVVAATFVVATSGVVVGLLRARLEQLAADLASEAHTDSLTGVANRRGFDDRFKLEVARAHRDGHPLSLIVCDLDRFKAVNDQLGHEEGDSALRRAAAAIAASVRSIDAVSRLGGEEFAVLLPNASEAEAFAIAERVRLGVLEEFADHPVPLTASCGLASIEDGAPDPSGLFQAADAALYRAKRSGRNVTIAAEAPA